MKLGSLQKNYLDVATLRNLEVVDEFHQMFRLIQKQMMIPLYLAFWIVDLIYTPEFKWEFLGVRILSLFLAMIWSNYGLRSKDYNASRRFALLISFQLSLGINYMLWRIPENLNLYFVGLLLILIGGGSFLPFKRRDFTVNAVGIFLPYLILTFSKFSNFLPNSVELKVLLTQISFIAGSIALCFLIRFFHENLREKEVESRRQLHLEIQNREEIIQKKTEEGVIYANLSRQFSPQVVESIQNNNLNLNESQQEHEISVLFVDIASSTAKALALPKKSFELCINLFLETVIQIFLKYDLTVDKFLGDGILAFCNAPTSRPDHALRLTLASLETAHRIHDLAAQFQEHWKDPFEIRMGLSIGKASVGFFGTVDTFRTFTAIGPVVNLASRLCSQAKPGEIWIDENMKSAIQNSTTTKIFDFKFSQQLHASLKGFETSDIKIFKIDDIFSEKMRSQMAFLKGSFCPDCHRPTSIELNAQQSYVSICRNCCQIIA